MESHDSTPSTAAVPADQRERLNREAWLEELKTLLTPRFTAQGLWISNAAVTCGWPSHGGAARGARVIGECWNAKRSTRGRSEVFISPTVDDPVEVAHVLMHELIHAALPDAGHGPRFKRAATALGLEGQMTATVPSAWLVRDLHTLLARLPAYPHGRIDLGDRPEAPRPIRPKLCPPVRIQGTRMLKVSCPACGYILRTTAKCLRMGIPTCPNANCGRYGSTMTWTGEGGIIIRAPL